MQLRLLNVAVDGGDMRVLLWGTGKRVAVAGGTGGGRTVALIGVALLFIGLRQRPSAS